MSELTRKEKVNKLVDIGEFWNDVAYMTDAEINDLYDQHFNKVTKEDFEGFKRVMNKMGCDWIENLDSCDGYSIDEVKKELNL